MSTDHSIPCRRGLITVTEHVAIGENEVTSWSIVGASTGGARFRMALPRCRCAMHVCATLHRDGFGVLTPTLRSGDRAPGSRHHQQHCHRNHTERVRRVLDVLIRSYGGRVGPQ